MSFFSPDSEDTTWQSSLRRDARSEFHQPSDKYAEQERLKNASLREKYMLVRQQRQQLELGAHEHSRQLIRAHKRVQELEEKRSTTQASLDEASEDNGYLREKIDLLTCQVQELEAHSQSVVLQLREVECLRGEEGHQSATRISYLETQLSSTLRQRDVAEAELRRLTASSELLTHEKKEQRKDLIGRLDAEAAAREQAERRNDEAERNLQLLASQKASLERKCALEEKRHLAVTHTLKDALREFSVLKVHIHEAYLTEAQKVHLKNVEDLFKQVQKENGVLDLEFPVTVPDVTKTMADDDKQEWSTQYSRLRHMSPEGEDDKREWTSRYPGGDDKREWVSRHPGREDKREWASRHPVEDDKREWTSRHPGGNDMHEWTSQHPGGDDKREWISRQPAALSTIQGDSPQQPSGRVIEMQNQVQELMKRLDL
ncbi:hypothetical protein CYMTET_36669 [Cymbomonas tetramitiformis]|uniref:Uncharacterized protein n=1 Tax=Cymbomonas tetramitiformis TaxID=36881 RepID=A0AAE0F705_9CHLO|nr:hypothetical protein CYMTET_36669 [Cymbomonas tetramitiformis]